MDTETLPSCVIRDLSRLAYGVGHTQWAYKTQHQLSEALSPGYFDNAIRLFARGDVITVIASDGVAMRWIDTMHGFLVLREMA